MPAVHECIPKGLKNRGMYSCLPDPLLGEQHLNSSLPNAAALLSSILSSSLPSPSLPSPPSVSDPSGGLPRHLLLSLPRACSLRPPPLHPRQPGSQGLRPRIALAPPHTVRDGASSAEDAVGSALQALRSVGSLVRCEEGEGEGEGGLWQ